MNQNGLKPKLVLIVFTLQSIINWLYVFWVRQRFEIVTNAWFTLTPMFTFFYCAFTFFAIVGLFKRSRLGIGLAYWIILFGIIADVLSYELAFESHYHLDFSIIVLIIMNVCVLAFMAFCKSCFYKE